MIDYTHRLAFDVLAAPLAEIDRRTLSQAWYSALHLAGVPDPQPQGPHARAVASRPGSRANAPIARASQAPRVADPSAARSIRDRPEALASPDRRSPRSELSRRIERIAARPIAPARGALFALRGPFGRVQILIRAHAGRTHLVAICSKEARADVARALDQARYALARGGVAACSVRVRGDER